MAVAVAAGIASRFALGDLPIDYDSANYAYVATHMAERGMSPLAFFNNKPPGIYYWYRAFFGLFGNGPLTCHLTSTIPDLVVMLMIGTIGRTLASDRVGDAATAIYATLQPAVRLAGFGYTESPLTACLLVAGALVARSYSPGLASVFLAGLAVGIATLFKQPAYLLGSALAVWGIYRTPRCKRLVWALTFVGAVILVQLGLLSWLNANGSMADFVTRVFVQGVRHGYASGFSVAQRLSALFWFGIAPMPALVGLGVASLLSRARLACRGFAYALIVPTLAIGCLSYEFYDHYLIPALPALSLLVGEWLVKLERHRLRRLATVVLAFVQSSSLAVFVCGGARTESGSGGLLNVWRRRPLSLDYQRKVAAYVEESTALDEPILSTGSDIPYLARRRNAYRYLGIAPYLERLDPTGFSDFPVAASRVRILVLERWRTSLLPAAWVADLDANDGPWVRVTWLDHPEFVVYRRDGVRPTVRNP